MKKKTSHVWHADRDPASPTVRTDSVMITTAIEAHKKREITVVDVEGAFPLDRFVTVLEWVRKGEGQGTKQESSPFSCFMPPRLSLFSFSFSPSSLFSLFLSLTLLGLTLMETIYRVS